MPVTSGSAGGLPGMTLKAWALVTPQGVIVKSFNVTSFVKNSAGNYTLTFTAAMLGADYVARLTPAGANVNLPGGTVSTRTTAVATLLTGYINGGNQTSTDVGGLWEIYE